MKLPTLPKRHVTWDDTEIHKYTQDLKELTNLRHAAWKAGDNQGAEQYSVILDVAQKTMLAIMDGTRGK